MKANRVAAALFAGALAAGCNASVQGVPQPALGQEGLFDPCKDIPGSVLEEVGLDPATERGGIAGVEQPGWKICKWSGSWFYLTVYSTTYTIEDVRRNSDYGGFEDVTAGTRRGIQYQRVVDEVGEGCYLTFPAKQGSIWINVEKILSKVQEDSSCAVGLRASVDLDPVLPN